VIANPRFGVVLDRAVTDGVEVGASGETDGMVAIGPARSLCGIVLGLLKILPVREKLRSLPDHGEPLGNKNRGRGGAGCTPAFGLPEYVGLSTYQEIRASA
jgi:hypothetical protein